MRPFAIRNFPPRFCVAETHTLRACSLALLIAVAAASAQATTQRVIFVDNHAAPGGAGTPERPFATLGEAARAGHEFDVIFVAETDRPYPGGITLSRGQMLIGSAYGLDAVRSELHVDLDAPPVPAARGAGPAIDGSVIAFGDNVVAGVTITSAGPSALMIGGSAGPVTVINTYVRPSRGAVGIAITGADFPVTFTGGGLQGRDGAFGLMISGGRGDITFDRFNIEGEFNQGISIVNRAGGRVAFRGRASIDIANATHGAITITDDAGSVAIGVPLRAAAHGRGMTISKANVKIDGGTSSLSAIDGNALEIHDAGLDVALVSVSATGGGVVIDKVHGSLAISGEGQRDGSGGAVSSTLEITQSEGVRVGNMSAGALHLRHVAKGEIENVVVSAGMRASNLEDFTFAGLRVRGPVALEEAKESVRFTRCAFEDGAFDVTQQFNSAKVIFDGCSFSAPGQPLASPVLLALRTAGGGKLDVELRNAELHDNAASALRAEAAGTSALALKILDSRFEKLGRTAIEVAARDGAHVAFTAGRTTILIPAVIGAPAIDVAAAAGASACAELFGNGITTGSAAPNVRLAPSVGACH